MHLIAMRSGLSALLPQDKALFTIVMIDARLLQEIWCL